MKARTKDPRWVKTMPDTANPNPFRRGASTMDLSRVVSEAREGPRKGRTAEGDITLLHGTRTCNVIPEYPSRTQQAREAVDLPANGYERLADLFAVTGQRATSGDLWRLPVQMPTTLQVYSTPKAPIPTAPFYSSVTQNSRIQRAFLRTLGSSASERSSSARRTSSGYVSAMSASNALKPSLSWPSSKPR